jgi:hypothetical protein
MISSSHPQGSKEDWSQGRKGKQKTSQKGSWKDREEKKEEKQQTKKQQENYPTRKLLLHPILPSGLHSANTAMVSLNFASLIQHY